LHIILVVLLSLNCESQNFIESAFILIESKMVAFSLKCQNLSNIGSVYFFQSLNPEAANNDKKT
jgi:hypothetical protein